MKERLNVLEENKKIILQKLKEKDTKTLSKKWKILYGTGYIGMMVITTIILYPNDMMLALLLTALYVAGAPTLQTVIDNKKIEKLRKEYSSINREIEQIQKEIINECITEERLKKDIPITSYEQYKKLEDKVLADLDPSEKDRYLRENESFFMGEEYDETSEDIMDDILSYNKEQSKTRTRKRV